MKKIQVLIVDDNRDTREGTRRLLEYEDDIEIVDVAENGAEAIDKTREHRPDVILMDINMPVMDGITATQQIQSEFPRTQIIVVSVQDDTNYMREAIRAGAVDFVAKPISADELSGAIRRAYSKMPSATAAAPQATTRAQGAPSFATPLSDKSGRIISVLGAKGGVGKTTIATNLGIGLVRSDPDKDVLIIDADPYFGDVGVFLNTRGQHTLINMASMAEVPEEIDHASVDNILVSHESGVKLLISPSNPADAGRITASSILNMLDYFRRRFDYIIIDTSTTLNDILSAVIQSSDRIVLVTLPTMPALKDTRIMLGELVGLDYPLDQVSLVLNGHVPDGRITTEQISRFLHRHVAVEIPADPTADEALNRGVALVELDGRKVPSARALTQLVYATREAFERVEMPEEPEVETKPKRGGLFGVLRGDN